MTNIKECCGHIGLSDKRFMWKNLAYVVSELKVKCHDLRDPFN